MAPNLKYPVGFTLDEQLRDVDLEQSSSSARQLPADGDQHDFYIPDDDADDHHEEDHSELCAEHECFHEKANNLAQAADSTPTKEEDDEHTNVQMYTRKLSSLVTDPVELSIDDQRLSNAAFEAGEYSFGVVAVEVWIFDQDAGCLVKPKAGWWCSPSCAKSEALRRLEEAPADPVMPGVDLAGTLWTTSSGFMRQRSSAGSFALGLSRATQSSEALHRHAVRSDSLVWRDLHSLIEDPDTAKGPRLALLEKAGFGLATGVLFSINGHRGLVVYFARSGTDREMLCSVANESYLYSAASMIGSSIAFSETRRALVTFKKQRATETVREDKDFDRSSVAVSIDEHAKEQPEQPKLTAKTVWRSLTDRLRQWYNKCYGGDMQIPPPLSFRQSLWTIFGAFCSLLVLSGMNELIMDVSDNDYLLLLGPFGALMTLQYGLTAAPASQPRNVVLGQAVSGAVSLAFTYIPESVLPVWLRRAVGPAFGIGAMVKLGVTHPPAGAHAVIYASGQYNWGFYAFLVLASAVSVLPATVVNNLSLKRQYPTHWGYLPSYVYKRVCGSKKVQHDK